MTPDEIEELKMAITDFLAGDDYLPDFESVVLAVMEKFGSCGLVVYCLYSQVLDLVIYFMHCLSGER